MSRGGAAGATTSMHSTNVLTADHAWAHRVVEQVRRKIADPHGMRALGFCVSVEHARFMAEHFTQAGLPAVAIWGDSPREERSAALRDLAAGRVQVVFTVDLFNEGVDVPHVDTLLLLRPTESPHAVSSSSSAEACARPRGKDALHRARLRRQPPKGVSLRPRFRALLGGSRAEVERQVRDDFPFLPAGCSLELDPVAREIVLRSIRDAIPSDWREKCGELRSTRRRRPWRATSTRPVSNSRTSTRRTTAGRRCVEQSDSQRRRGPERGCASASGRPALHVDDEERLDGLPPASSARRSATRSNRSVGASERLSSACSSRRSPRLSASASFADAASQVWDHPQVRAELLEISRLASAIACGFSSHPLGLPGVPLRSPRPLHARRDPCCLRRR